MSANINLRNIHINRDTRILNSSTVTGSTSISLDDITIGGKAVILENLNITDFCNKAQEQSSQMSNSERESIQNVIAHQGHTNF